MKLSIRWRLALTVLLTGLATACGVIVTVALAFQRFEHESAWQRADAFLTRVTALHDDLLEQHARKPDEFAAFLRNLVLYDPDNRLYLLDMDGRVLASTGARVVPASYRVPLGPVREAAGGLASGAYVMGEDPEQSAGAEVVVAARALRRAVIRNTEGTAGYLYLVRRQPALPSLQEGRLKLLGMSLASPALLPVLGVVLLASLLAAWIIVTVTRPLRVLSDEVARAARQGFTPEAPPALGPLAADDDEIGRLRSGFQMLLARLRLQWDELRRMDQFRRESVSNLSHDLRSPLTATTACLETLSTRWQGDPSREPDRELLAMAMRNTHNAAGMVRALGDLAQLDEPSFSLRRERVDLAEVLDGIVQRFGARAAQQGLQLSFDQQGDDAPVAEVDIELFERAMANLLDNAFKATPAGGTVRVSASRAGAEVTVQVADSGAGIAPEHLPRLFERLYQAGAERGNPGKGLGLAIVQRIAELHQGRVAAASTLAQGTVVTLELPAAA